VLTYKRGAGQGGGLDNGLPLQRLVYPLGLRRADTLDNAIYLRKISFIANLEMKNYLTACYLYRKLYSQLISFAYTV
jgi:hypothetical protein